MSLIEEYYELNEAEHVSSTWKILQILFCACAAALGLTSGFSLAVARQKFADRCYLFTEVKISHEEDHENEQIIIWESDTWCNYYQFTMVSSFIVGIIWATLFLMCGKGGKSQIGLPQPWRIVWPSLIFNLMYFVLALSTAIRIQQGTDYFCRRKRIELKKGKSLIDDCQPLKLLLKRDFRTTSILLDVVSKTSWACAASWFLLFLLSFLRIIFAVDFQLYKITMYKIDENLQNKREEVIKITSYEEPKSMYYDENEENVTRQQSQETLEYLETENIKIKSKRHYNTSQIRDSLLGQTSTFYATADIRTIKLQNKKKKCLKALDETFDSSSISGEMRKSVKFSPTLETGFLLKKNLKNVRYEEDDENETSSTFTFNNSYLDDESDIATQNFDSVNSLIFKKQI